MAANAAFCNRVGKRCRLKKQTHHKAIKSEEIQGAESMMTGFLRDSGEILRLISCLDKSVSCIYSLYTYYKTW